MKNKHEKAKEPQNKQLEPSGISKTGKKVIFAGIITLIVGYYILTKTDPSGQNWASNLSPFLILGGYCLIGAGIIFQIKKPAKILNIICKKSNRMK
jgi:hypothetical protein